jgi:hypothetical protein
MATALVTAADALVRSVPLVGNVTLVAAVSVPVNEYAPERVAAAAVVNVPPRLRLLAATFPAVDTVKRFEPPT